MKKIRGKKTVLKMFWEYKQKIFSHKNEPNEVHGTLL